MEFKRLSNELFGEHTELARMFADLRYPASAQKNNADINSAATSVEASSPTLAPQERDHQLSREHELDESSLPKGACRYILLVPEVRGQRCSCMRFTLTVNKIVPGFTCTCGHKAVHHRRENDSFKLAVAASNSTANAFLGGHQPSWMKTAKPVKAVRRKELRRDSV